MLDRTWGPVITAVEAGHVDHEGKCPTCKTKYPCAVMKKARDRQGAYAVELRHQAAVRAGVVARKGQL